MPGSGKVVARAAAPLDCSGRPGASAPKPSLTVTAWRTRLGAGISQKTIAGLADARAGHGFDALVLSTRDRDSARGLSSGYAGCATSTNSCDLERGEYVAWLPPA
jgi:hypothetical protein